MWVSPVPPWSQVYKGAGSPEGRLRLMYGKGGKWLILEMVGVLRANRVHNQCRPFVIPRLLKD